MGRFARAKRSIIAANAKTTSKMRYIQLRTVKKLQAPVQMWVQSATSKTLIQWTLATAASLTDQPSLVAATSIISPVQVPLKRKLRQYHHPPIASARTKE